MKKSHVKFSIIEIIHVNLHPLKKGER